jgi:hypothetical protein
VQRAEVRGSQDSARNDLTPCEIGAYAKVCNPL